MKYLIVTILILLAASACSRFSLTKEECVSYCKTHNCTCVEDVK